MGDKIFSRSFAGSFQGIDAESSALEGDPNSVVRAINYEWALSNNLRGRSGSQMIGQSLVGLSNIFTHSYSRIINQYTETFSTSPSINGTLHAADGATISQQLALGKDIWRQDTYNISITRTAGSVNVGWYATVGGNGNIHFILTQGGATYLDYDCGNLSSTTANYYTLLQAIDGTANFSVSFARSNCPPYAIINGAQTPSLSAFSESGYTHYGSSSTVVTVTAGHTFLPGDYIISYLGFWGYVISTTATTITFLPGRGSSINISQIPNGTVLGILGYSLAQYFPIDVLESSSSTYSIAFPFYRPVGNIGGIIYSSSTSVDTPFTLANAVSSNGNCYIAHRAGTTGLPLFKYDGQMVSASGLPMGDIEPLATTTGTLTGLYYYRVYYKRVDAQGNIIEGTPSVPFSITLSAQGTYITPKRIRYEGDNYQYIVNSAYAAQTRGSFVGGATTLDIDNSAGSAGYLQVGDPICFNMSWDPVAFTYGAFTESIVTSVDGSVSPMTITMEGVDSGTLNDNTPISAGLSIVILRTTNNGTVWYKLAEIANDPWGTTGVIDTLDDATLSTYEIFTDPEVGKEHDPPNNCSLVCAHQGGLATSGASDAPNTVRFSSADGIEYFPLASNSFDVPSTRIGPITAIASDTIDRLAVFKEDSYYDVVGDLDGGQFTINVVNEGDYGVVSHTSLVRVRGKLIGLSKLGFVSILNGTLSDQEFRKVNARIVNQSGLYFPAASACNDTFARNYICAIRGRVTTANPNGDSTVFVLDYSRKDNIPLERSYQTGYFPNSFCMYGDSLYFMNNYGIGRRLYRFNEDSPTGNNGDSYIDHTYAINYILETQALNQNEPGIFKSPTRMRVYSIPNEYIVEGWVPFSMAIDTSIFPDPSYFGSSFPGGISSTITFSSSNDWYRDLKLSGAKCLVLMVRFTTNTIRQSPFVTGFEIVIQAPYKKEDLQK